MNAGTAVGAVAAPPLIALTLEYLNWRWVFFLAGSCRADVDVFGGWPSITRPRNIAA